MATKLIATGAEKTAKVRARGSMRVYKIARVGVGVLPSLIGELSTSLSLPIRKRFRWRL